jgi:tetratricopeptide (TPR) repeat protein
MDYAIKHIRASGVEAALQKADKYRELGQPAEAESICRDVLAVDPDHQLALRILGLALTDRFESFSGALFGEAQAVFGRLRDPYEHAFYAGLVYERQAKAQLAAHLPAASIRALFDQALTHYAEAERLRPPGMTTRSCAGTAACGRSTRCPTPSARRPRSRPTGTRTSCRTGGRRLLGSALFSARRGSCYAAGEETGP